MQHFDPGHIDVSASLHQDVPILKIAVQLLFRGLPPNLVRRDGRASVLVLASVLDIEQYQAASG